MKPLDRFLQRWRIRKAAPYIAPGISILDIGCYDGALFKELKDRISFYVGVDPLDYPSLNDSRSRRIVGVFPDDIPEIGPFDVITMLAVLEHFPFHRLETLPFHCAKYLKSGGLLVVTIPSPSVDYILKFFKWIRIIEAVGLREHYGLAPEIIPSIFCREYFDLKIKESFQLGLNNLLVFQKKGRQF